MKLLFTYRLAIAGAAIGAVGGYFYYTLIGCASGSCPITSSPVNSTIYGALLGAALFDLFRKTKKHSE